jgi:hypothetical protein
MAHRQRLFADGHGVAVGQPARRREGLGRRKAEHAALLRQAVDPELVARMRPDDGQRQAAREFAGAARVVDVRMREPDLLERDAELVDGCEQPVEIAAGVDDRGLLRGVAPHDGTVLLERGDGDGLVAEHRAIVNAQATNS